MRISVYAIGPGTSLNRRAESVNNGWHRVLRLGRDPDRLPRFYTGMVAATALSVAPDSLMYIPLLITVLALAKLTHLDVSRLHAVLAFNLVSVLSMFPTVIVDAYLGMRTINC